MNKKVLIVGLSILTGGIAFIAYTVGKNVGFDAGAKHVGEQLFNGDLTVKEVDPNTGEETIKVVEPVLKDPDKVIIDVDGDIDVVHN